MRQTRGLLRVACGHLEFSRCYFSATLSATLTKVLSLRVALDVTFQSFSFAAIVRDASTKEHNKKRSKDTLKICHEPLCYPTLSTEKRGTSICGLSKLTRLRFNDKAELLIVPIAGLSTSPRGTTTCTTIANSDEFFDARKYF